MKTKHAFIAAHASEHAIRFMCRVLGVAHSWFHARRRAAPKRAERVARRGRLGSEIREIFEQSKRCYGAPRIHAELKARGFRTSKRTVAKLMRENGIRPPRGRRRAPITTDSRHSHAIAPNLLDRNFEAVAPDAVWLADISYSQYGRYGYRRITALLRTEGWHVNAKRVQRIWWREGLKVPQKQPKRGRLWLNDGSCIRLRPCWPNHVWSYDFVMDRTHDGRKFRMLTVIDEFTRRCMAVVVERRLNSDNVLHCLTELFVQHGPPDHIRSDNGSEFTAHAVRDWLGRIGVKTLYIEPGSPWENGYNESFNSKLRDEILNTEIFSTLKEAKVLIERWRHHYNTIRPHSSLGYRPPAPETILPNVDGPTYAVDGLWLAHQLNPRQTLT